MQLKNTFVGHQGHVNSIAFSVKAAYLASGGKDGKAMLWNMNEGSHMKNFECDTEINQVLFAPKKFFLVVATVNSLRVYDLVEENMIVEIKPTPIDPLLKDQKKPLNCLSVAWDKEGKYLYSGWSDNIVRVYEVVVKE